MKFSAKVHEPMYEFNEKKYLRLVIPETCSDIIRRMHTSKAHLLTSVTHVDDALEGRVLKVKVPFRYRRVMCAVEGRPVQSLARGDEVEVEVEFKGAWNAGDHSGFAWVLVRLKF